MSDETPTPAPAPAASAIPQALHKIAAAQLANINRHGVQLTDADVERHMPTARDLHIQALERDPHPVDATMGPLHEWAAQRIAVNLAARDQRYDVERTIAYQDRARRAQEQRVENPHIRPMSRTADSY